MHNNLTKQIMEGVPQQYEGLVEKAVTLATKIHVDSVRSSGEHLLPHLLKVAANCTEMKLDTNSIIAAILHQSISPGYLSEEEILNNKKEITYIFGEDVLDLVESLEQINRATDSTHITDFKVFNRYLLGTSKDIRPIMIKIADALDNVRTISAAPEEIRESICTKILNIYGPLAEYLNLRTVQKELEECAFKEIKSEDYTSIQNMLDENSITIELKEKYLEYLKTITDILGYKPKIFGRIKSKYSIYKKLKKYFKEGKGTHLSDIKDLLAFTIVVQNEKDCFEVSNAIKALTEEEKEEFTDYITNPKPNGYSALQIVTSIPEISQLDIEVQIVTAEMYYINTYGPASHIAYKASQSRFAQASNEYSWVEQIHNAISEHINHRETERSIPIPGTIFETNIFVLTPKGTIIELQKGDTALDFAYRVHTQIGHKAIGAIVNTKGQKLSVKLESGDVVEIVTDPRKKSPSRKFLEYANSRSTIRKINLALKDNLEV